MSIHIGLRLFQQLKSIDPAVSHDDYFEEESNTWDVEALEEDLKVTQDRLQRTGTISLPNRDQNPSNHTPIITNINPQIQTIIHSANPLHITHGPIITNLLKASNTDEDIDVLTQMPSPNASPSIEYDASTTESDIDTHNNTTNTHNNTSNGIQTAIKNKVNKSRKRKSETVIQNVNKKRKTVHINKWNEVALKKLQTLKRQVKNSAWFWEPVDEAKHSAPNYYLVCPLPSDYGTICDKLEQYQYYDLDDFLRDCELVFINARLYNTSVHAVHLASMSLEKKFKESMNTFVLQHCGDYGSRNTLKYWQNAKKNYKPFAVPIDDDEDEDTED